MEVEQISKLRSSNGKKCLNFLHIPKVAGTTVEVTGKEDSNNIEWGKYDKVLTCKHPFKHQPPQNENQTDCLLADGESCPLWHTPPSADAVLAASYAGCDTFCIVRHPVDRMFSEFRWQANIMGLPCDVDSFRKWIKENLQTKKSKPFTQDCHFVPQFDYVFSQDHRVQYCKHIIDFDNMEAEFNALMRRYDIPITLRSRENAPDIPCEFQIPSHLRNRITNAYRADCKAFHFKDC